MTETHTPSSSLMQLSIIIPAYNEGESLPQLIREIDAAMAPLTMEWELLLIDDGSTDATWRVIQDCASTRPRLQGIRLRRNFGKAAAILAGVQAARGSMILTMDADLQDDPMEIPRFIETLGNSLDVVSGWKQHRQDPWHKVWPSKLFNFVVSRFTGLKLHDHNCGMKLYRKEVFQEIRLYGELHRFIPVLAHARGYRVGEMPIQHRPRRFGRSKYGMERFTRGFLDLLTVKFLTDYRHRPQHLLGYTGLLAFALGFVGMMYLMVIWFLRLSRPEAYDPLHTRPLLLYSVASFLLGAQLMSMGLLAELIMANPSQSAAPFSIAERTPPAPVEPASKPDTLPSRQP